MRPPCSSSRRAPRGAGCSSRSPARPTGGMTAWSADPASGRARPSSAASSASSASTTAPTPSAPRSPSGLRGVRSCDGRGPPRGAAGRRRAALAGVFELGHVQELRGARRHVPPAGGGDVSDTRWETRGLALVAAILVVVGLTAVYGASSLLTIPGGAGQVGSSFALRQALGAAVGGIVAALLARPDYRAWRPAAGPLLAVATVLLPIPLLPL